jgi:hypothetical protein
VERRGRPDAGRPPRMKKRPDGSLPRARFEASISSVYVLFSCLSRPLSP